MKRIDGAITSGYRHIILCAPTGVGKSHIAMAFARAMGTSHTLTAQKILQGQYSADFAWLHSLQGKTNFPCMLLCEEAGVEPSEAPADGSLACSHATCAWNKLSASGEKKSVVCEHLPSIEQYRIIASGTESESVRPTTRRPRCSYYDQKCRAFLASHTICNYASYFWTRLSLKRELEKMFRRCCIVADEAHEIEDQLIDVASMDVYPSHLSDVGLNISDYVTDDIDGVTAMISAMADAYLMKVSEMEDATNGSPNRGESALMALYRMRLNKINSVLSELLDRPENMIIQPGKGDDISLKPLDVDRFARSFFDMGRHLFMSATVHKNVFCKTMGIVESECAFIEIERSPFPPQHRAVRFEDLRWLNRRSTDSDYAAVYSRVTQLLLEHADQKGLILTTRKDQCEKLVAHVRDEAGEKVAARLRIVHNDTGQDRKLTLAEHADDSGSSVLVSPSLWYGVDLKGDLSRFQIIIKAPYLSLGDERTKAKMKKNRLWYQYSSLTTLLQGMGRSVRDADDYAVTYVLDEGARDLVQKMRKFVPSSYSDVLGGIMG